MCRRVVLVGHVVVFVCVCAQRLKICVLCCWLHCCSHNSAGGAPDECIVSVLLISCGLLTHSLASGEYMAYYIVAGRRV